MNKESNLQDIADEITSYNVCSELAEQAMQLVFGDGNPDAEIVFIGEAPGKKEDESGVPFVGSAGKFLQEMLQLIHLDRKDIYITNIVKYRPPNNRDPLPEEKSAFWPYLVRQLDVIKPILPEQKIGDVHGQPNRIVLGDRMYTVLPLYHPAAALYNGGMRQTLKDDFSKIPDILKTINK